MNTRRVSLIRLAQDRVPLFEGMELELWDRSENQQINVELPDLEFAIGFMCAYEERHGQDTTALQIIFPGGDRIWLNGKFWRKDW